MKTTNTISTSLEVDEKQQAQFLSLILASSIHEIKNTFGKLVFSMDNALAELPDETAAPHCNNVHAQVRFISNQLSQILMLYKEHQSGYAPHIEETSLAQLLHETQTRHCTGSQPLQITTQCDDDIMIFIDENCIVNVLDTFIYNAQTAGATHILLSAEQKNAYVELNIDDNGPGFPPAMIEHFHTDEILPGVSQFETNSFGLGLFFAKKILKLHTNNGLEGRCSIANHGQLGGATVKLQLP